MVLSTSSCFLTPVTRKMGSLSWKLGLLLVVLAIIGCQSQTFQYSRGWTNGKRSGQQIPSVPRAASQAAIIPPVQSAAPLMYDDGPIIGIPFEDAAIPISSSSGTFRLFPTITNRAESKGRTAEYSQFLTRKLGNGSNPNRKPPMWIVDVDQSTNGSGSISNNNNNSDDF